MYPGYHFVDDLWDVWDKGRHYQHSVDKKYVAKSTWAADVKRSARAQQAAKASRFSKLRRGASLASWFVPGLGTYKVAKAGHKLLFGVNLIGDVTLAYWMYNQIFDNDRTTATSQSFALSSNCTTELDQHDYLQGYYDPISPWRTM